jgi:uncharacterized membrane protein
MRQPSHPATTSQSGNSASGASPAAASPRALFAASRSLRHAREGNVVIIAALVMTVVIGCGAMAVDLGALSHDKRSLQSASDAAAQAAVIPILQTQVYNAATDTSRLNSIVAAALAANGYPNAVVDSAVAGTYCIDPTLAPSARFTPGIATCANSSYTGPLPNAVQTSSHIQSPYYLARIMTGGQSTQKISVVSTAIGMNVAGFQIGTGLARIDTTQSPLLNPVLGGMLGTSVSLSAVSYQGLASTQLNALGFLDPLATSANVNVATIGGLANASANVKTILQAEASALGTSGSLTTAQANALTGLQLLSAAASGSGTVQIGQLLNAGVWPTTASDGSVSPTALQATVNAFQVATAAIQMANGTNSVSVPTAGLNLTGLANLTLSATAGTPATSGYPGAGLGYVGSSASTSQVNLAFTAAVPAQNINLGVATASTALSVQVGVVLASGQAKLTSITCGANPSTDAVMTIAGTTSLGTITATLTGNIAINSLLGPLVTVKLNVPVTTQLGGSGPTTLSFTQADVANQTVKTIGSTNVLSTTTASLMTSLSQGASSQAAPQMAVTVLGINLSPLLAPLITALTNTLSNTTNGLAATLLNPVIDQVTTALGVEVGYMDVTATGVRCGVPALVN